MVPRSLFAGGSLAWVLVEFVYGSRSTAPERSAHAVRPDARRHAAPLTIGACLGGSRRLDPVGDVPAHVANGRALLINDYAASPVQARALSLVAGAKRAA